MSVWGGLGSNFPKGDAASASGACRRNSGTACPPARQQRQHSLGEGQPGLVVLAQNNHARGDAQQPGSLPSSHGTVDTLRRWPSQSKAPSRLPGSTAPRNVHRAAASEQQQQQQQQQQTAAPPATAQSLSAAAERAVTGGDTGPGEQLPALLSRPVHMARASVEEPQTSSSPPAESSSLPSPVRSGSPPLARSRPLAIPRPPRSLGSSPDRLSDRPSRKQHQPRPTLKMLLRQQRQRGQDQQQQDQQQQQRSHEEGQPSRAQPWQSFAAMQRQLPPTLVASGQKRQQHEQQQLLHHNHFRALHLRAPVWLRTIAEELLRVLAKAGATNPQAASSGQATSGTPPFPPSLAAYDIPEIVLQELAGLLPPFKPSLHPQQAAQRAERALQLQQQELEDGEAAAQLEEEQQTDDAAVSRPQAGDVFASELDSILSHHKRAEALMARQEAAASQAAQEAAQAELRRSGSAGAGSSQATPEADAGPRQQRSLDEGGLVLLLRCVTLMGGGVRSGLAVLLAAQRAGYPRRSPAAFSMLQRLASMLVEVDGALALLHVAEHCGMQPDQAVYHPVLDACAKAGKTGLVRKLMQEMEARGLALDGVTHTILLMAYEKAGDCDTAIATYDAMRAAGLERTSFTYRALISALVNAGRVHEALRALDWMADDGVAGNAVVYQTLINAFLERGDQGQVDRLLQRMRRDGVRFSHQAVGRLCFYCFGRNQPQVAFQLFKAARELGLLSLEPPPSEGSASDQSDDELSGGGEPEDGPGNASGIRAGRGLAEQTAQQRAQAATAYCRMIASCHRARLLEEAWCVYGWMVADGLHADRGAYSRLISVCAYSPARSGAEAEALYERITEQGVEMDAFMYLHLVTALASDKGGDSEPGARWPTVLRVLHNMHMRMPQYRDTHVQTVAISLAARHGRLRDALAVYRLMLVDGVRPSAPTFNALMAACMRAGHAARGFQFFQVMQAMGVQADVVTVSTLIACCERMNDWQRAEEVWRWMVDQGLEPDTICYNTMISCMERCNQPDRALRVFENMTAAGVAGSSATYAALCDVFAKQGRWEKLRTAVQVKEWMEAQGEDPGQLTYAELTRRASGGGNWRRAVELFEGAESSLTATGSQPNVVTYSAAIIACARLADWRRAVQLKDQLAARGLPASNIVYNSVLAACEAARQLAPTLELLEEMRAAGVPRDVYTYSTAISCCHHEGQLETAMRLFWQMREEGITPNTVVLNALLGVCASVGNADAAEDVYRHAVEGLGCPADDITVVCLIEACARAERWADGLRRFLASCEALADQRGVLHLDLSRPEAAAQVDLHFLSVMSTRVVLRAWLLYHKLAARRGQRLPPNTAFCIVTGWGRNSAGNVPRLKPEVGRMLAREFGAPLSLREPASNLGAYDIRAEELYDWLEHGAELGFAPEEEEEAWALFQQLRDRQRSRQQPPQQRPRRPKQLSPGKKFLQQRGRTQYSEERQQAEWL